MVTKVPMFASQTTDDPLVARGDRLVRWGAFVPAMGFCVLGLFGRLFIDGRHSYVLAVLILSGVGQVLAWLGIEALRRSRGWNTGVVFYIWVGGALATVVTATTAIPVAVPVPLIAPVVATLARWRMAREKEPTA